MPVEALNLVSACVSFAGAVVTLIAVRRQPPPPPPPEIPPYVIVSQPRRARRAPRLEAPRR